MARMSTSTPAELNSIVDRVRGWEPASRLLLARRILDTLAPPDVSDPRRDLPPEKVFGLLKSDRPTPTDDEVEAILADERLRKLG